MSHEIDFTTGIAAISYTGQVPWHGYGQQMDSSASLEQWRAAAQLDWKVKTAPVTYEYGGVRHAYPNRVALLRDDTGTPLSIVSKNYKIVQPDQVVEFYRDLIEHNGFKMDTMGALYGGRRVWALASIDDAVTVFDGDTTHGYLLVATSYDGTFATQASFTSIRVVCNNTLMCSQNNLGKSVSVPHNQKFDEYKAKGELAIDQQAWLDHKKSLQEMAKFQISPEQAIEYFYLVSGQGKQIDRNPDNNEVRTFPEPNEVTRKLMQAYTQGPGHQHGANTAYGLLQAVTFYQDHVARATNNGTRFASATFGSGSTRKLKAKKLIEDIMQAA